MPTFNQLKDKSGYYIRAWTPDTGNITYKLKSEADPIISGYGLRHEDEISWDVIKSMKLLRLIYTDGSGILEVGDFEPDPDQLEETSLSERQAKSLLSTIQEHHDLTQDQIETICSILGIDVPGLDTDLIQEALRNAVTSVVSDGRFPVATTLGEPDLSEIEVSASTWNLQEEDAQIGLRVLFASLSDDPDFLSHSIFVSEEYGITNWLTGLTGDKSWMAKSEIAHQMAYLIPTVVETLRAVGIDPGHPEDPPGPVLRDFTDMPF
jgi:hypothetical protein